MSQFDDTTSRYKTSQDQPHPNGHGPNGKKPCTLGHGKNAYAKDRPCPVCGGACANHAADGQVVCEGHAVPGAEFCTCTNYGDESIKQAPFGGWTHWQDANSCGCPWPHYEEPGQHQQQEQQQQKKTGAGFSPLVSLADLLKRPPNTTRFLLDGLLPTGGTSMLVARPRVGKSTFAQALMRAVAAGTDFLGKATTKGPVLYLALEEKDSEVQEAFRAAQSDAGLPIMFYFGPPPEQAHSALCDLVAAQKPALVVVDTLGWFSPIKQLNEYGHVSVALQPIHALARRDGNVHIMTTHHGGKGEEGIFAGVGSIALAGCVDTVLAMRRDGDDGTRYLEAAPRYGDEMPLTKLTFDAKTRNIGLGDTVRAEQKQTMEQQIVQAVRDGYNSQSDIEKLLHHRHADIVKALGDLVRDGLLIAVVLPGKGGPIRYTLPDGA